MRYVGETAFGGTSTENHAISWFACYAKSLRATNAELRSGPGANKAGVSWTCAVVLRNQLSARANINEHIVMIALTGCHLHYLVCLSMCLEGLPFDRQPCEKVAMLGKSSHCS